MPGTGDCKHQQTLQREIGQLMSRWSAWIRAAARPEELRGRDPTDLAFLLWGLHHAVMIRDFCQDDAERCSPAEQARLILDFFLHGLGPPEPA